MITVAVAGLLGVQLALLSIAWDLKDRAFRRNATTALSETVRDLEAGEIASDAMQVIYSIGEDDEGLRRGRRHFEFTAPRWPRSSNRQVFLDSTRLDAAVVLRKQFTDETHLWHNVKLDSFVTLEGFFQDQGEERVELISHIVGDLVVAPPRPIRERLQPARIDSLLRENLREVGIDIEPRFAVLSPDDEVVLHSEELSEGAARRALLTTTLRAELFPLDLRPAAHRILLQFPGQNSFLMRQIGPLLGASLLFLLVIIATFALTLRKIGQQNRFFTRLIDFINNMTHEFKTPISTVSLASEALARPDILERPEALARYNAMIRDENLRMRRQVEKILQIAHLETGDLVLHRVRVDMHELARGTAEAFALQIEDQGGRLELDLQADDALVDGDPVHLDNVLANLVDNAIKYSGGQPWVIIRSRNRSGRLVLEVADRGPGIARAEQELVFEKYYRSPTGNRHDVKGHGLGLSFVRLLVQAHGGGVELDSAPGRGTRIIIGLPLAAVENHPERRDS